MRYKIKKNNEGKVAIFNKFGKQISKWWDELPSEAEINYFLNWYNHYVVKNEKGNVAVFHKDNPDEPVTGWWKDIVMNFTTGIHIVQREDGKKAILNKEGELISKWWKDFRYNNFFLEGKNEYYVAVREDGKQAIFHKSNPDEPITDWWYRIRLVGILDINIEHKKRNNFYLAERKPCEYAIFYKNGTQISDWLYYKKYNNLWDDVDEGMKVYKKFCEIVDKYEMELENNVSNDLKDIEITI